MQKTQKTTMFCKHCHQDLRGQSSIIINGEAICIDCLNKNYYYCSSCHSYHLKTDPVVKINNSRYCPVCVSKGIVIKCDKCGEYHLIDSSNRMFGKNYCNKCYKMKYKITSYHTRPDFVFHGEQNDLHFGVELENYHELLTYKEHHFIADLIEEACGVDHLYFNSDGSLENKGFEIITHPHTMEAFENMHFEKCCKILQDYNYNEQDDHCGLHIHFSRNYFTEDAINYLVYFYSKYYATFLKLSGRTLTKASRWAASNLPSYVFELGDKLTPSLFLHEINCYSSCRCSAVNLHNSQTIEFRLGAGSTDYNKIKLWIDIHYTICKNANNIDFANKENVEAWFSGRNDLLEIFKGA